MPKIGAAPGEAERPYVTVCTVCGCRVEKAVSRFGPTGQPAAWAYLCQDWRHRCGTAEREGCKPKRLHCTCSTDLGGVNGPDGPDEDCPVHGNPEIVPHLRTQPVEGGHGVPVAGYDPGATVPVDAMRPDVWEMLPDSTRCGETDFESGRRCEWPVWPEHRTHSFTRVPGPGEPGDPWPLDPTDEDI